MLRYVLTFLAGGTVVTLVTWLAGRGNARLAGLLIYVPVVSIISYSFVAMQGGGDLLRPVVLKTFLSLPPLVSFLLALSWALTRYDVWPSMGIALAVWLVAAISMIKMDIYLYGDTAKPSVEEKIQTAPENGETADLPAVVPPGE